jgi:hypothetical protein
MQATLNGNKKKRRKMEIEPSHVFPLECITGAWHQGIP